LACPENLGDWYFTGDYPTPGGNRVVNRAFVNFFEGKNERAY
jgi:amidophosphoribosyltransferase